MDDFVIRFIVPISIIGLTLVFVVSRMRRTGQVIEAGLPARITVSAVLLGIAFVLGQVEGLWLGLLFLALALGTMLISRAFIPEARTTRWHWPTVIVSFVVVPMIAFTGWIAANV